MCSSNTAVITGMYMCAMCGVYLSGEPGSGENVPDVVGGIGVQQSLRLEERRSVQSLVLPEDAQDGRWGCTQTKCLIGVI